MCRLPEKICVYPADVVLFEGILVFYTQEVRDMFHMKLFVDTDSDVRLSRRGNALIIIMVFFYSKVFIFAFSYYFYNNFFYITCCVRFSYIQFVLFYFRHLLILYF